MLGEALRLMRSFHGLKQYEVAERLGVSKSHISEVESGAKVPSIELLQKYSEEFGIPLSSILFFAEELPSARSGVKIRHKVGEKVLGILRFIEDKAANSDGPKTSL